MKRNPSKYISIAFLALFLFTFSFQNISAITRNFKIDLGTLFNGKYLKTIHTPADSDSSSDENPFENETEDESETEFNPALPIVNFQQNLHLQLCFEKNLSKPHRSELSQDTQHPLYLVIRTFKI